MKPLTVVLFLASVLLACSEDDGKYRPIEDGRYRPTEATTVQTPATFYRTVPTTTRNPFYRYNDPRLGWTGARQWPYDRVDQRQDIYPRVDSRFNTFNADVGKAYAPRTYHDYRTVRLDEKVDAKGYRYVYETIGGILAEEAGTFLNIGLKNEGVRAQGYVQITDTNGVTYRIDYQTDSKEAYIPLKGEAPRTPPAILKLLSLLELHK